jgi:hypothetical protein
MSEQRALYLRKGLIGACAFAALLLLASFYWTVSGAVERAAKQRLAGTPGSAVVTLGAAQQQRRHANPLLARVGD